MSDPEPRASEGPANGATDGQLAPPDVRVCFVGPMLGRNPGWVTTQGEILADLFRADGWSVQETSTQPSRPVRLVDTISCLVRWRRHIDVVVLSVFSGPAFLMADVTSLLTRLLGLPTVMVLRGGNLPAHAVRRPRWVRRVLGRASVVVAPSSYLDTPGLGGRGPTRIVPNVVDLSRIDHRHRPAVRPRLLWMRTFHPAYNPALAVRTVAALEQRHPDATLTMAGQEKGLSAAVRAEVEQRGLGEAVTFAGFLEPGQKRDVLADHDVFLNTNHVDNTPVSVIEAAAAGLPVVATAVGGIPDLLTHEETALLVPDDDHEAMADAVDRLLREPELAARLSTNGRRLAEQSAWPAVRERWTQVFAEVLASD